MMPISDLDDETKKAMCNIKAKIKNEVKRFTVGDSLLIDYESIEEEMEKFPNTFYLWAMIYSEIKEQKDIINKKIRKRKGILYRAILDEGGKSLRRSDIDDLMSDDSILDRLEIDLILISKQNQKIWYILESLRMKNDNMRSLSGFRKQELYNERQTT